MPFHLALMRFPPILGSNVDWVGNLDFYLYLAVKRQTLDQHQRNLVKIEG